MTGGANVPALNELLATWGIAFGDTVLEGDFTVGPHDMSYASGTGIVRFPQEGIVLAPSSLKDQGSEVLSGHVTSTDQSNVIPVLGFYQVCFTLNTYTIGFLDYLLLAIFAFLGPRVT